MQISALLSLILFILAVFLAAQGFQPFRSQTRQISLHDRHLLKFAISMPNLGESQVAFIRAVGKQLEAYSIGASNNLIYYQLLTTITISASFVSVGITGTSFLPCEVAKNLSFSVNLVAALITGLSQFYLFDRNAQTSNMAAGKLRLELLQFIGRSDGYAGQDDDGRYGLFVNSIDNLMTENLKNSGSVPNFDLKKTKKDAEEAN